ncbi:MAG: hypothetical protein AAFN10_16525 [Bacteroidota bacterium]
MKTLLYSAFVLLLWSCNPAFTEGEKKTEADSSYSALQLCLFNHLTNEPIAYPEFLQQATGSKANYYRYDQASTNLYFSISFEDLADRENLTKICLDTTSITFGDHLDEYISLDGLVLPDSLGMIFRFPTSQLRGDTTRRLSAGKYSLTLAEAVRWYENQYVYNGPILFTTDPSNINIIPSLSPTVAVPGSPSLKRLVRKITSQDSSKEVQAQQLLDFASSEIDFKPSGEYDVFFRPHEVLLAQRGDTRGKLALYASLLGEAGIPCMLVYLEIGPTIAVAGDFVNENRLNFLHEGQEYSLAEPTIESFVIGKTKMMDEYKWSNALFVQYPGKETRLFDLKNQDSLDFVSVEMPLSQ